MTVPTHVRPELVIDFDHQSGVEYVLDPLAAWDAARGRGRLLYTEANGGHWVMTDPDFVREVLMDPDLFSSRQIAIPTVPGPPMAPLQLDPPIHGKYRKLLLPYFTPRAIEDATPIVEDVIAQLIANVEHELADPANGGVIDFCHEFAHPLPAMVITRLLGLPQEDSILFRGWVEDFTRAESPQELRVEGVTNLRAYLRSELERRRDGSGEGMLTTVAAAEIDGEPIDPQMAENTVFLLVVAGLDTTISMLTLIWRYLALNPGYRKKVTVDDETLASAREEMIRVFTGANASRTVTRDVEWNGYQLKEGDLILLGSTAANRAYGEEPRMSIEESGLTSHLGFGHGYHRCVGLHLARKEIQLGLKRWHERFPEYEPAVERFEFYGGNQFQLKSLPLRITS